LSLSEEVSNVPLVSVVIPTHNRKSVVTRCVESVLRSNYGHFEVVVVDDGSIDGTFDHLSKLFPSIILIRCEHRGLVSAARNIGCKRGKGELVFFVDDDNVIHPNAITELVKAVSGNANVGIAGPIMYYLRDPEHVWCSGTSRNYLTSTTRFSTSNPNGSTDCYPTEDIPNAFMVRRSVFSDAGYFDAETFAQHMEEADFCRRAAKKGYQVIMVPRAMIWHDVPVRSWPYRGTRSLHISDSERAYYVARNRILFMRKYAGVWRFIAFTVVFLPPIALTYITMILKESGLGDRRAAFAESYVRGLIDAFDPNKVAKEHSALSN
jgi:GT2 family glycosyltransferase